MDWNQLTTLARQHAYSALALTLAIGVVGIMVRTTAQDSRYPPNLPPQWRPVLTLGLADLYALLVAWPNWQQAVNPAVVVALATLAFQAYYFTRPEPAWITWLARVVLPMLPQSQKTPQAVAVAIQAEAATAAAKTDEADLAIKSEATKAVDPDATKKPE